MTSYLLLVIFFLVKIASENLDVKVGRRALGCYRVIMMKISSTLIQKYIISFVWRNPLMRGLKKILVEPKGNYSNTRKKKELQ